MPQSCSNGSRIGTVTQYLIAEVQGQLGMKPGQWKEARKNAAVKEAFKHIETDGSGKNCKIKRSENVE